MSAALTRKSALLARPDRDRQTGASLVETCKLSGADTQANLIDVIIRIVGGDPDLLA